jgi:hypothetical protein
VEDGSRQSSTAAGSGANGSPAARGRWRRKADEDGEPQPEGISQSSQRRPGCSRVVSRTTWPGSRSWMPSRSSRRTGSTVGSNGSQRSIADSRSWRTRPARSSSARTSSPTGASTRRSRVMPSARLRQNGQPRPQPQTGFTDRWPLPSLYESGGGEEAKGERGSTKGQLGHRTPPGARGRREATASSTVPQGAAALGAGAPGPDGAAQKVCSVCNVRPAALHWWAYEHATRAAGSEGVGGGAFERHTGRRVERLTRKARTRRHCSAYPRARPAGQGQAGRGGGSAGPARAQGERRELSLEHAALWSTHRATGRRWR